MRDGVLLRDGRPYRGIGANGFDLFSRRLGARDDPSGIDRLRRLRGAGIPFVRFACCGFWPIDWGLYRTDPATYFRRLDEVVDAAEACGIGLIPSLFWNFATVPDLVNEPLDQLGNRESASMRWIRSYIREVVSRYRRSPAIWGWELGNEYSLEVDLPNASEHRPPVHPDLKTARSRSARDELTSGHLAVLRREFSGAVRAIDPVRPLFTGNGLPRPSAWHNTRERSWKADSPGQFAEVLARDNGEGFDTLTVRLYPRGPHESYRAGARTEPELIDRMQDVSRVLRKPLFVGEFGVSNGPDPSQSRAEFSRILEAIVARNVALAAFWVYDFPGQDGSWNITLENERAFMIDMVAEANQKISSSR